VERDRLWAALQDPAVLARSLPGLRRLEVRGPDEFEVSVSIGVGSVRGIYEGTVMLADKRAPESCRMRAEASGTPGSVDADARMTLTESPTGARLAYDADPRVSGPAAGVGQRLIAAAARRTTDEFLDNVERALRDGAPDVSPAGEPPGRPRARAASSFVPARHGRSGRPRPPRRRLAPARLRPRPGRSRLRTLDGTAVRAAGGL
jgi:carbon monoxide dehydrogenase subunit G